MHDIRLHGATDVEADLAIVQDLLGRLRQLDGPAGDQARETALRLAPLDPEQQQTLHNIIDDPPLLNALRTHTTLRIALGAATLSEQSRQAVLGLVEHLTRVENTAQV